SSQRKTIASGSRTWERRQGKTVAGPVRGRGRSGVRSPIRVIRRVRGGRGDVDGSGLTPRQNPDYIGPRHAHTRSLDGHRGGLGRQPTLGGELRGGQGGARRNRCRE